MPSVTYDVRHNALYETLKNKARQLKGVEQGILKAIFLGDAGCRLLRDIRPIGGTREVTGEQIIRAFLERNSVDFVLVFVPRRASEYAVWNHENPRMWFTYVYAKTLSDEAQINGIKRMADMMPSPYLHGYQARSWHQQRMFDPQGKGHYLAPHLTLNRTKMTLRISARGLQEFMAGRLSLEQLKNFVVGDHNPFEFELSKGRTIRNVSFEPKGTDSDDDYLIFEFEDDPAAQPLKLPGVLQDSKDQRNDE
jgi:hypothetical protein